MARGAAEQRIGARLVTELDRVAAQFGAGDFHPLARFGQERKDLRRGVARAGLVRAAEEENPRLLCGAGCKAAEVLLGGLHAAAPQGRTGAGLISLGRIGPVTAWCRRAGAARRR